MNEDIKVTQDFNYELICSFFGLLDRQGPGSEEITKRALGIIGNLPESPRVADLGCGTGRQTVYLAENTQAHITAVDLLPQFTEKLQKEIAVKGLQNRISVVTGPMDKPPFGKEDLDMIWAEGSIYNIGYENGLKELRKYLKPGGYIAVSEVSWFTPARPVEIESFWNANYDEINTIPVKVGQMQDTGYMPIAHFILPELCWIDEFYKPMDEAIGIFLDMYGHDKEARDFIETVTHERSLYMKYKDYYGYVFYIGKKIGYGY